MKLDNKFPPLYFQKRNCPLCIKGSYNPAYSSFKLLKKSGKKNLMNMVLFKMGQSITSLIAGIGWFLINR